MTRFDRQYMRNLKPKFSGFKVLRGYEYMGDEDKRFITLLLVSAKEPRTGAFTRLCQKALRQDASVVVVNPASEAMMHALKKNDFILFYKSELIDAYILTPLTKELNK